MQPGKAAELSTACAARGRGAPRGGIIDRFATVVDRNQAVLACLSVLAAMTHVEYYCRNLTRTKTGCHQFEGARP